MPGDRRLADALARSDDRERRQRERLERGRIEPEVGTGVRNAERKHATREPEALWWRHDGLVGQVDDDLRAVEVAHDRDAVLLSAAQLFRAAGEPHADHVVRQLCEPIANNGGVVLTVDDDDGLHLRAVTSPSMRAVYFSNSSVSTRNWMIFSCPWNGYLRHTSTCVPVNSITL